MPVLTDQRSDTREVVTRRLSGEFTAVPSATVHRCVADVLACATHLGLDATPALVERMAREHLVGMEKSRPPSAYVREG
ncbi:hypothetical protein [Spirillospora albida]|uniref:hypothetical protein n=1 Tax=Spirillospora albida TaxID=58123 RepID=UPI0004C149FD|nr:hypothetical protein [Spirillospora albida]